MQPRPGPWFRLALAVIRPATTALTRRDWRGREHVPARGGVVVANHVSLADPLVLAHFVYAAGRGEAVVVYPEGTITTDPGFWPMAGRTGVARLALGTGAPVVPVALWGPQEVLGCARRWRQVPRVLPRRTVRVLAGPPVDFSRWQRVAPDALVLRGATAEVMRRLRTQVAELRGEPVPGSARPLSGAAAGRRAPSLRSVSADARRPA